MSVKKVNKHKITKREAEIFGGDGGTITGNLTGISDLSATTIETSGLVTVGTNIKAGTNGTDLPFVQFDDTEVARVHDGGNTPTATGTAPTTLTSGTGLGWRRRVLTLGSGNNDNVLTLTAADSGCVIAVTPTNNVTINLPLVGTETGWWCSVIVAANHNKDIVFKTNGQDGADNIFLQTTETVGEGTTPTLFDVGEASDSHDILTWNNAGKGSKIDFLALAGGAAEKWLANVIATDSVVPTASSSQD